MNPWLRNTLKITAAVLLLLIVFHFWPALAGITILLVLALLGLGGAVVLVLSLLLAVTAAVGLGLISAVVAIAVSLAPLWIPVLAVIGLIALFRHPRRPNAAA